MLISSSGTKTIQMTSKTYINHHDHPSLWTGIFAPSSSLLPNHTSQSQCVSKKSSSTRAAIPSGTSSFGAQRRTARRPKSSTQNSGAAAAYAARETSLARGTTLRTRAVTTTTPGEMGRGRRVSSPLFGSAFWLCVIRL